ncbi:hypothetical protein GCM10008014_30200 [Paenibacillus silvae]|uniref:Ribosomal RNA large subunit methyltransferase K/L-like methyltransferase domain-containing protein n=1 Tax=Paenibacillus silvae TaxID=1325358 RepID=A0ABQ1ZCD1_9BACL|nr:THUMP domain-containing class I SAM-dependent methyltransferase [Paenibacillus silvae]GGH58010.1 hypothetical protein GCM10008014_30200 [Paenibacillus silvae]
MKNSVASSGAVPHRFLVTMVPGFEEIVREEIEEKILGSGSFEISRGKVSFRASCNLDQLLELKCADNIYYQIAHFRIGPHKVDLKQIPNVLRKIKLIDAINYYIGYRPKLKVIVRVSRVGKHTYSRFDASDAFLTELVKRYSFGVGSSEDHDLSFRVDIVDEVAILSLKLTPAEFRYRTSTKQFSSGAIRPTIAHVLVRLSNPQKFDSFFDPFCGSGTIAAERAYYDSARIVTSDINPEVVALASLNVSDRTEIYCWDACQTPLDSSSITTIVSNLPWGKQIVVEDITALYMKFLLEAKRILRNNGKIIALTDQSNSLIKAAESNEFECTQLMTISLHGLHPSVFVLTKL